MLKKIKIKINVVNLSGVILANSKKGISLNTAKSLIDKAFIGKSKNTKVAIVINSPGGSPVQSEMLANYIQYKSNKTGIDTISFVEDYAASGGYWLALSSNEVYALSNTSIVGSLGVVSAGFGFDKLIKKHDIQRRVYTAGTRKVSLDSFQEEKSEDIEKLKDMLEKIHVHFKNWVLKSRKNKLKIDEDKLFSGEYWIASEGVILGLIDGVVSSLEDFYHGKYGNSISINYVKIKKSIFSFGIPFLSQGNVDVSDVADVLFDKLDEMQVSSKYTLR